MLSAVSSMQTEASCARNHSKLGHLCSLCPCQLPPPHPHALNLAEKLPCQASVHKMNRPHIHTPQISSVPGKSRLQGCQKALERRMEGQFELKDFAALSWPGKLWRMCRISSQKWTGCGFSSAPCLPSTPAPLPAYVQVAVGWAKWPAAPAETQVPGPAERRSQPGIGSRLGNTHTAHLPSQSPPKGLHLATGCRSPWVSTREFERRPWDTIV